MRKMSNTNEIITEEVREKYWKKVGKIVEEAESDEVLFEVIEEIGSSISSRNVWEQIKDLAEEVLENATLEE